MADGDRATMLLDTSFDDGETFANLRLGRPGPLPRPVDDIEDVLPFDVVTAVNHALRCTAWGAPETVRAEIEALTAPLRPDEVIVNGNIWDADARIASFEIAADVFEKMALASTAAE